jgi:hypothetical protein
VALLPGHPGTWRIWSVSTLDWRTRVRVEPESFPWARALNGSKGGSASFKLGDPLVAETANTSTLAPWERMLVAEYQGLIVYAGFITGTEYDRDSQTLTVTHEDLWAVLSRRLMADTVSNGVQTRALVYTGVTLNHLARGAVFEANNDAARFNLPISIPVPSAGSVSQTYHGYSLPTAASVLNDIMDTEGGPDIDFFPRWYGDDQFEWLMRVGEVSDVSWEWDVTAPKSLASGLRERRDGSNMANRIAAVGEGSEKNMLVAVVDGSAGSSFLPLDASPSYKDESSQSRLAARARADLAARSKPTKQVSMDVLMDDNDFAVHMLRLGGTVRWKTQGDPYFPNGWKSSRLIEFSGDLSKKVHLEFQEV